MVLKWCNLKIFRGAAMSLRNEPLDWQVETNNPYIPVYHQGNLVGFLNQNMLVKLLKF
ncbi:hypothetical protein [Nostoc sp. GT001]|uniref:hypothetical protein n=1 Tax=Nostoc sp. GT001 TaxID=3056647 RepID=UPI0025AAEAB5|nr:hypothetical protein [Nostoc sp. GT001]MDM9585676.1 hypothetical protein [Nostoc sp. GT001]